MNNGSFQIAKVVVGLPVDGPFDYFIPAALRPSVRPGQRVSVLFNRRLSVGTIVELKDKSKFARLNPILNLLDKEPSVDENALMLAEKMAEHYGCSRGEAIEAYLPAALRKKTFTDLPVRQAGLLPPSEKPTHEKNTQSILLHAQDTEKEWTYLLERIRETLEGKKSVIILSPEAWGLDNIQQRLKQALTVPICSIDKKLTPQKELENWINIKKGECRIVLGTRSAVFAPLPDLGLVIITQEENDAYKQEQNPHYHVRDVAEFRQSIEGCRIIYASYVPSAETWDEAKKKKWPVVTIPAAKQVRVQIADMTNYNPGKTSPLSFPLQNRITQVLAEGGKIILFMNRRGFSTMTRCSGCGFTLKCPRCDINLVYLYSKKMMTCSRCGHEAPLPKVCPSCHQGYLRSSGTGIERLVSEASRLYPAARIRHFDQETTQLPADANIIIATQAIMKYNHSLKVALTAVINFDSQLNHVDFRSAQKAFALLVGLSQMTTETLFIQTRMPEIYCVRAMKTMDFAQFYRQELKMRRQLGLPPYNHLVAVGLRGINEAAVMTQCQEIYDKLKEKEKAAIEVLDPHPDVIPKLRDKYRFTIVLKGRSVPAMLKLVKSLLKDIRRKKGIVVTINVDP